MATFGYKTIDVNTSWSSANQLDGTAFTCPSAGLATSITMYVKEKNANAKMKFGIYKVSDDSLVGYTEEWTITGGYANWKTLGIVSGGILEAVDYWLVGFFSNDTFLSYTIDVAFDWDYDPHAYNAFPDPWVRAHWEDWKLSIYCTYITPAPPLQPTLRILTKGGAMVGGGAKIPLHPWRHTRG